MNKNKILNNINVVLVRPQISENIGLAARVLKNTGCTNLTIVGRAIDKKSQEVAKRARDVLDQAKVYDTLNEALGQSNFVFGTTRRQREYKTVYNFENILPQLLGLAQKKQVSLLFGAENFGLAQEELEQCDSVFCLPANSDFSSYNLAMSIGIVTYRIFSFLDNVVGLGALDLAKRQDIEKLYDQLSQKFSPTKSGKTKLADSAAYLKRIFQRTHLTRREIEVLRALVEKS
jgi:TrmH family RNA methyltransferase